MELDLERVKLTSSVKTMSPSAAEQTFMAKLEERDREILKLRQEVAQITDKINMVIDTKDAQIRVSTETQLLSMTLIFVFLLIINFSSRNFLAPARPWRHGHDSVRLGRR